MLARKVRWFPIDCLLPGENDSAGALKGDGRRFMEASMRFGESGPIVFAPVWSAAFDFDRWNLSEHLSSKMHVNGWRTTIDREGIQ